MEHHADFAFAPGRRIKVETDYERPDGGAVGGPVLAVGWWVNPPGADGPAEPTGTLYLVADESLPRPIWVAQERLTRFRVEE